MNPDHTRKTSTRWRWFALLYVGGVLAVAALAYGLRLLLGTA